MVQISSHLGNGRRVAQVQASVGRKIEKKADKKIPKLLEPRSHPTPTCACKPSQTAQPRNDKVENMQKINASVTKQQQQQQIRTKSKKKCDPPPYLTGCCPKLCVFRKHRAHRG